MEQSLEGGGRPTFDHANANAAPKTNGQAANGYHNAEDQPSNVKYQSPRNQSHHKPIKQHPHPQMYYGNMHAPAYQYNPAMMHMNGRYYNPHIVNPPLPPLPPNNPSPIQTTNAHDKSDNNAARKPSIESESPRNSVHEATSGQAPANQYHSNHSSGMNDGVKCHKCGEKGHIAPVCPTKRPHYPYTKPQNRICKYWMSGHCQKGEDCLFVHGMLPDPSMLYPPGAIPMPMMHVPHYKHPAQQGYAMDPNAYYYPPMPQAGYGYESPALPQSPAVSEPVAANIQSSPHRDSSFEYQNGADVYPPPHQTPQQPHYMAQPYYPQHVAYDGYGNYAYPAAAAHPNAGPPARQYPSQGQYQGAKGYQQGGAYYPPHSYHASRGPHYNPQYSSPAPAPEPQQETIVPEVNAEPEAKTEVPPIVVEENAPVESEVPVKETVEPKRVQLSSEVPNVTTQVEKLTIAPAAPTKQPSPTSVNSDANPSKSRKKKKNKQSNSATPPPVNEAPLSEKGLRNDTGENNCFLNVVVQALHHLQTFQEEFVKAKTHNCAGDGRCVFCALSSVFGMLSEGGGDMGPVSSESLRKVLSAISTSPLPSAEERYKAGSMDDAAEAHETIVRSLHEALATSATPCDCVVHHVFGLWVGEEAVCKHCGSKMQTQPYDAMVLHVATEAMKEALTKNKSKGFESLLSAVWAVAGSSKKCSSCRHDKVYESRLQLKQVPRMFTLGMTWKNNPAHSATLKVIVSAIEPRMNLGRVFPNMVQEGLLDHDEGEAKLMGMYCFFGHHYMAFIFKRQTQEWLSFNDTVVKRVGNQWSDVQKACLENHYQPYVLFYDVEPKKEKVVQFTIGDFVMSVPSDVDQENWRTTDNDNDRPIRYKVK